MSTKTDDWEKEFDEIWEARPAPEQRTHLKEAIKEFITSHTTYWTEKVRKEVEGMKGIYDENGLQTQWIQKAEILQKLDNLK